MNPRETALIGFIAAVFSLVFCGALVRVAGQQAHLSRAQTANGLAICLAGVVVGLLLVLCVSAFQEAKSAWDRSLGALGLVFGCALLFALLLGRRPLHVASLPVDPAPQAAQEASNARLLAVARGALSLAPGTSR
jgi:hypothetical protein